MYTLLGAPLLGFDLARRPGGARVATLVRDALAVGPGELADLGAAYDEDAVGWLERARAEAAGDGGAGRLAAALRDTAALVGNGRVGEALRRLETAPVAGLPELLGVLRDQVFDWTWSGDAGSRLQPEALRRGVVVLGDAVVAAWHGTSLSPALGEQLTAPYLRARVAPTPLPLGPQERVVLDLMARVAGAGSPERAALLAAAERARRLGAWGTAMHSATWAVHLSGRERAAVAAQMDAVRALAAAGVEAPAAAAGTWNLVSGATQALVVGDLLDTATWHRLVDPVTEVLGPLRP